MTPSTPETVKLVFPVIDPLTLFAALVELIVSEAKFVIAPPSVTLPAPELMVSAAVVPMMPSAPKMTTPEPPLPPELLYAPPPPPPPVLDIPLDAINCAPPLPPPPRPPSPYKAPSEPPPPPPAR